MRKDLADLMLTFGVKLSSPKGKDTEVILEEIDSYTDDQSRDDTRSYKENNMVLAIPDKMNRIRAISK